MPEPIDENKGEPGRQSEDVRGNRGAQHQAPEDQGSRPLLLPRGLFPLGQLVATPGAIAAMEEAHVSSDHRPVAENLVQIGVIALDYRPNLPGACEPIVCSGRRPLGPVRIIASVG